MSIAKSQVIDKYLSGLVQATAAGNVIADEVFPVILTDKLVGRYIVWDSNALVAKDSTRGMGADPKRSDYDFTTSTFQLPPGYTGEVFVDRREEDQTKGVAGLDLAKQKVMLKKADMDREKELKAATIATTAGNYTTTQAVNLAGSGGWGAIASTVFADIETAKYKILQQIGENANKLVVTPDVWAAMRKNTELQKFFINTNPGAAAFNNKDIAKIFGLDDILVATATYYDTTTATTKYCWGTGFAGLYHSGTPQSGLVDPSALAPSFGWTLQLSGYPYVDTYYENKTRSDVYGVNDNYLHLKTSSLAGILFTSVLT